MFTVSVSFFSCSVTQPPFSDVDWNNSLPRRPRPAAFKLLLAWVHYLVSEGFCISWAFVKASMSSMNGTISEFSDHQTISQLLIKWTWQWQKIIVADWASNLSSHLNYLIIFRCKAIFHDQNLIMWSSDLVYKPVSLKYWFNYVISTYQTALKAYYYLHML